MRTVCTLALACLVAGCEAPPPQPSARTLIDYQQEPIGSRRSSDPTAVQGLIGVSFFDEMEFARADPMDPTNTVTSDVSTMPTLGFAGHYRLFGSPRSFEGGLDGSLLFSWMRDSSSVTAVGGGGAVIKISINMFITDIGFGMYGSQMLGESFRLYAGAGPLVQFGNGNFDDELTDTSESGFGVGWYARVGFEYELKPREFLGIGVRGTNSEIDFGGSVGDIDTDALQVFVTYTMGF